MDAKENKILPGSKVPCSYIGCNLTFNSVQEMIKHKLISPDHDYCAKCDEDFEDEERLLLHKVKTPRHKVCCICGVDFKSEVGRDHHIRQYHRADQNLVCHGCQGVFKTASGLVRHIETDECPAISKIRLLREQTRKMCIKEALSGGRGENLPVIPSPRNPDDINGGVKLGGIAKNNREAMLNRPKLGEDDPTASVDSMLALKHWPRAGQDPAPAKGSMSDLMDFDPEDNPGPKGNGKAEASPGPEEQQQVVQCGPFGMNFLPDAGQTLRMIQRNWDATTFFNSFNGRYICPGCGGGFADKNTFEEHTLIESHDSMPGFQCPGCSRTFKTTSALVAHCESVNSRCPIHDSDKYDQFISDLTGGMVQTSGYHHDGSIKYEAVKLDNPQTTTIGKTMHKTIW